MTTVEAQDPYEQYLQRLIAASLPISAVVLCCVTALYAGAEWFLNREGFWAASSVYVAVMVGTWIPVAIVRGRAMAIAERVALLADCFYTAVLAVLLLQPTTTLSGAALFFSLKMLSTALFFPWHARTQYLSAAITVLVYWALVFFSSRTLEPAAALHQLVGPFVAALFSAAGARSAELRRRNVFDRGLELAASTQQLEELLREVRKRERQLLTQQSEQQVIFDSVPALIWYKDRDNRILRANRPAAETVGRSVDEVEGASTYELYPEDAAKYHADDLSVINSAEPKRGILDRLVTDGGDVRWMQTDKIPYRDEHGNIIGVIVFAVDVTERKRAEEELEFSRQELENEVQVSTALAHVGHELISELNTPVILDRLCQLTIDALGCDFSHVLRIEADAEDPEFVSAVGIPTDLLETLRVVGSPLPGMSRLLRVLDRRAVLQFRVDQLREPTTRSLARKLGMTVALSLALRRGGHIFGILTVGYRRDHEGFSRQQRRIAAGIAHLASLALENARLVEELARANGIKSEFVATMSHELRTPLNVITGYGSLLSDGEFGNLNEEQQAIVGRILKSAGSLLELINATLDLSRLEAGRVPLVMRDVDLHGLCAKIIDEVEQPYPDLVRLLWNVPRGIGIYTDPTKLNLVLKNLVQNALKFTESGTVQVTAAKRDEGIEIEVRDTGIGIDPGILPTIFEAFRQGDSSTTRRHGGVGLGLFIVKQMLQLLQGTIDVESVAGQGTTFRVWLPTELRELRAA